MGAILGNSPAIEMCDDRIRVSHGFQNCQLLACVAESQKGGSAAPSWSCLDGSEACIQRPLKSLAGQ